MKQFIKRGHQGDVQIRRVDSIPSDAILIQNKPIALGEKSGHMHVMCGEAVEEVYAHPATNRMYFKIGDGGSILHHIHESDFEGYGVKVQDRMADHPAIEFAPGIYETWIQTEFNPYTKHFDTITD